MKIKFEGVLEVGEIYGPIETVTDKDIIDLIDMEITSNSSDARIVRELGLTWKIIEEDEVDGS